MSRKNRSKLAILLSLGSSYLLSYPVIKSNEVTVSSRNDEEKSLINLKKQIDDMYEKLQNSVSNCSKFKSKFINIYLERLNGSVSEDFYEGVVSLGKVLCDDCFSINKSLLSLVKEYEEKLISEINSTQKKLINNSNTNKIKIIHKLSVLLVTKRNFSSLKSKISSNLSYLEHWLWFVDGKLDFPPFDRGVALTSYENMKSIEKEYKLPIIDLENTANNLYYTRDVHLNYYNSVKSGKSKFNSFIWKSILEEGESLILRSIQLNEQLLDAYSKKYDSIKSDENTQKLKNDVYKMIEHFRFNLNLLNKWKDYISENKNAQSLPDPIKEF